MKISDVNFVAGDDFIRGFFFFLNIFCGVKIIFLIFKINQELKKINDKSVCNLLTIELIIR